MPKKVFCLLLVLLAIRVNAQENWSLEKCVAYAVANNISIKQADVQARLSALQVKLSEAGRYPNAGLGASGGYNLGRSINPATNVFENRNFFFSNFQLQSSVNLFNWFSQK
ncbi:MAG TPA: TolC family protein, partial [Flavisolibacter sp.]|nr:TolC family protein [Flavisolibacter sp.]